MLKRERRSTQTIPTLEMKFICTGLFEQVLLIQGNRWQFRQQASGQHSWGDFVSPARSYIPANGQIVLLVKAMFEAQMSAFEASSRSQLKSYYYGTACPCKVFSTSLTRSTRSPTIKIVRGPVPLTGFSVGSPCRAVGAPFQGLYSSYPGTFCLSSSRSSLPGFDCTGLRVHLKIWILARPACFPLRVRGLPFSQVLSAQNIARKGRIPKSGWGRVQKVFLSMPNMTGQPGHRTMEMNGGSFTPCLACTPCVPLLCTLFKKCGNRRAFSTTRGGRGSFPLCGGTFARSYIWCRFRT